MDDLSFSALESWVISSMLFSLRIAPLFAFAPPFTLIRIPATIRALMAIGLAATIMSNAGQAGLADHSAASLFVVAVRELFIGTIFVLAFQIAFAALAMAGRTIDVQAGFGLALVIDPTTRAQAPLVGTLFSYAAGAIFFAANGHLEVLRLVAASLDAIPLGTGAVPHSLAPVMAFMSVSFLVAFGVAGGTILTLFIVDLAIAFLSRTVPQMNVLVLGFQVKTLVLLLVLPTSFGLAGALLARMMTIALEGIPRLL